MQLFERIGNKIVITTAGEIFLTHAEAIIDSYRSVQLDMSLQTGRFSGVLRIGASTTIAQYMLPAIIARFYCSISRGEVDCQFRAD